jgi:hypothetical protein
MRECPEAGLTGAASYGVDLVTTDAHLAQGGGGLARRRLITSAQPRRAIHVVAKWGN